ncbi:MAG: hypothetical protein CVU39_00610 [Chloroflexi bacterium HGW-Chloroflexi-10]|nr:MAG: hypothetical protein CVU39_00610 [Chloroflexi bacterium HGW-Chloroflexi-10]
MLRLFPISKHTFFLTTHFMEEAERLCDRVAITGDVLTNFAMIMLGIMLLLVLGLTVYRIQFHACIPLGVNPAQSGRQRTISQRTLRAGQFVCPCSYYRQVLS